MTRLIDDYLRDVDTALRVDAARRRQIVDELRTHLTEKVDELMATEPGRPRVDIEQEVLRDFGNPRDLALAYEPEGAPVLMNSAGEIVLRLGKAVGRGAAAVGRGTGKALKWVAIALAGLLVISLGVGAWAYYEVKPYLPSIIEQSAPAYDYYERCEGTPCNGAVAADTFHVAPELRTLRFDLDLYPVHKHLDSGERVKVSEGSVRVTVTDPTGTARFDRTFNFTEGGSVSQQTSWAAIAGNWTIAYVYEGFLGTLDVEAYAHGIPWGER